MNTILVTGGTGYVGRRAVAALQAGGHDVRVLALPAEDTARLEEQDVRVYRGDVRDPATLVEPVKGADAVLHLAGLMGVWRPMKDYHDVNVAGTRNICQAALAAGTGRLVHVSSWTVYGMGLNAQVTEDSPLRPLPEPYSVTKAAGDMTVQRMIASEHLPAVIIRPGTIFGPEDQLNFGRTADRLRGGKRVIVGPGSNALPLVYVTDVVEGLLLALGEERALGQAYNIGNDRPLTQQEFLAAIARELGMNPPRLHIPYRALYAAAYAAERFAAATGSPRDPLVTRHGVALFGTDNRHAIGKARAELGYAPRVPIRDGVRMAAGSYLRSRTPDVPPLPTPGLAAGGAAS